MLFSFLAIKLPPSVRFKDSEAAYDLIFGQSARIAFASLIAFTISDFVDIIVFQKIREKIGKKALWLRSNLSNFVSQFIDTCLFIFLAFYAFNRGLGDNFSFLFSLRAISACYLRPFPTGVVALRVILTAIKLPPRPRPFDHNPAPILRTRHPLQIDN